MLSFIFPLSQGDNTKGSPKRNNIEHQKISKQKAKSNFMARSQSSKRGTSISTSTTATTAFTTPTATTTTTTAATPTTQLQHNASKSQQLTQQLPDSSWRMIQTYPAWLILVNKFTYKCQRCNNLQLASCNKKRSAIYGKNKDLWCSILIQHNILRFQILGHWWMSKEKRYFSSKFQGAWDKKSTAETKKTPEGTREN